MPVQVLPILEPEDVAEQVVRGILTEAEMVVLPWYTKYLIWIKAIVPVRGYQVHEHPTTKNAQFHTQKNIPNPCFPGTFGGPGYQELHGLLGREGVKGAAEAYSRAGERSFGVFIFFKIFTLFARLAGCGIQVL